MTGPSLGNELGIALVTGLLQGSVYALVALGIVLVYRGSGAFNFAQTEFGTTGLFAAYAAHVMWGWGYPSSVGFGLAVAVTMGLLTERLVVHPLRNASRVTVLVGTAGVALAAVGFQFWRFNETLIMTMPKVSEGFFLVPPFGAPVTVQQLITVGVLIVASVALALFFRSPSGLAIQAAQQESTAAELVGISVRRVSMLTWAIAAVPRRPGRLLLGHRTPPSPPASSPSGPAGRCCPASWRPCWRDAEHAGRRRRRPHRRRRRAAGRRSR